MKQMVAGFVGRPGASLVAVLGPVQASWSTMASLGDFVRDFDDWTFFAMMGIAMV